MNDPVEVQGGAVEIMTFDFQMYFNKNPLPKAKLRFGSSQKVSQVSGTVQ